MITGVRKVVVPVDDQETALRFWTETVGFAVDIDAAYGDERWIEVAPPDQGARLILVPRAGEARREPGHEQLPHSDVFFTCDDIQATYAELAARGVRFPVPPTQQHFGWWSLFEDPDGTRYALGQF